MQQYSAPRPARLLEALGSAPRLGILELLRDGERCVCEITPHFVTDKSVISRHLAILENAGIIRARRAGRRVFYRIADHRVLGLMDAAWQMTARPGKGRPVGPRAPGARKVC